MKYKVGDKTLLGEITKVNDEMSIPYRVEAGDCRWFTEKEIDAIIIKPKRNIDRLIELVEAKDRKETAKFIQDNQSNSSWGFWRGMLNPYTEPSRYPKLTPEELKAVKWLVEGGYEEIVRDGGAYACYRKFRERVNASVKINPVSKCLEGSSWITTEPINLAELVAAQEEK